MSVIPREASRRVRALREAIHRHDRLYYILATPEISDEEYDHLMRELQDLEERHPGLVTPDSPTRRVGGAPVREFPAVEHRIPMLSLANTYSEEEIREFDTRVRSLLGEEKPSLHLRTEVRRCLPEPPVRGRRPRRAR